MATTAYIPVEVYLRGSYEPDAEYVDGEVQERAVGDLDHAAWQAAIEKWFWMHEREWNIRVFAELRIQVTPTRFRVPDVMVLERSVPLAKMDQIIKQPPIAVFEILSPEDRLTRTLEKCDDYERMGIQTILVINPKGSKYRYQKGKLEPLDSPEIDLPGSICKFNLREIEKLLD